MSGMFRSLRSELLVPFIGVVVRVAASIHGQGRFYRTIIRISFIVKGLFILGIPAYKH